MIIRRLLRVHELQVLDSILFEFTFLCQLPRRLDDVLLALDEALAHIPVATYPKRSD